MRLLAASVLLAACSAGTGRDRCERVFDKMASLGAFGGDGYGVQDAMLIGMGCKQLTNDDFACVDAARSAADLDGCAHFAAVRADVKGTLAGNDDGPPADPADVRALADATCACKDVACLVGVAERDHDTILRIVTSETTDAGGRAALDRMRECADRLGRGRSARTPPDRDDHDYAGKMHFFADQMCACTTSACAVAVQATESQWEANVARDAKPDDDAIKHLAEDAERMAECKAKLAP